VRVLLTVVVTLLGASLVLALALALALVLVLVGILSGGRAMRGARVAGAGLFLSCAVSCFPGSPPAELDGTTCAYAGEIVEHCQCLSDATWHCGEPDVSLLCAKATASGCDNVPPTVEECMGLAQQDLDSEVCGTELRGRFLCLERATFSCAMGGRLDTQHCHAEGYALGKCRALAGAPDLAPSPFSDVSKLCDFSGDRCWTHCADGVFVRCGRPSAEVYPSADEGDMDCSCLWEGHEGVSTNALLSGCRADLDDWCRAAYRSGN
jgi:hypothetical protein